MQIIQLLTQFERKHNKFNLFQHFCEFAAISLQNAIKPNQELEQRFLTLRHQYSDNDFLRFQAMFYALMDELAKQPRDVLGDCFMELELSDKKHKGQCFTPTSISTICGNITANETHIQTQIAQQGYYLYYEPCIGAGSLAIGFTERFKQLGFNPQTQLFIIGEDIDSKAVQMSYIQLSLLGIPAKLYHANPLTQEKWQSWHTPFYCLQRYKFKE